MLDIECPMCGTKRVTGVMFGTLVLECPNHDDCSERTIVELKRIPFDERERKFRRTYKRL